MAESSITLPCVPYPASGGTASPDLYDLPIGANTFDSGITAGVFVMVTARLPGNGTAVTAEFEN